MDVAPFFGSLLVIEQTREPVVKVHEQSQFDFDMGWGYGPKADGRLGLEFHSVFACNRRLNGAQARAAIQARNFRSDNAR
jgi:hypothetical protein